MLFGASLLFKTINVDVDHSKFYLVTDINIVVAADSDSGVETLENSSQLRQLCKPVSR